VTALSKRKSNNAGSAVAVSNTERSSLCHSAASADYFDSSFALAALQRAASVSP